MEITESISKKVGAAEDLQKTTSNMPSEAPPENKDFLKMLEAAFFAPVFSLVKVYLMESNGGRKTEENCILDFRRRHTTIWKIMCGIDLGFRGVYLSVVFIVVVRGLGLPEYILNFFQQ